MNNFEVIVLSCADFSDMWTNIFTLYAKYWPEQTKLRIISDGEGKYNLKNDERIYIYQDDMSNRLIRSLKDVESEYIFLSFDDYYPKKKVNDKKINDLLIEMKNKNIDYCRIYKFPRVKTKKQKPLGYYPLPLDKVYQVNFYPCLWKRVSLLKVLKENEDIWKTEVRLTRRSREQGLKGIKISHKKIFPFVDIVRKGKYLISGKRFIKKNNLFLSNRGTRTFKETFNLAVRTKLTRILPLSIKNKLKKRMNKKGVVFYSDYENTDD